jgi:ADP-ribose pyrophosphatase
MTQHWPQLGVGAIVIWQGRLLLVRRGRPPGQGLWAIPGGRVAAGEPMRRAAEREILEETGVRIEAGELAWQFEYIEHDEDGGLRFHYVVLDFLAKFIEGEALAGDDADAVAWVRFPDLPTLRLHPETSRLLKTLYPDGF